MAPRSERQDQRFPLVDSMRAIAALSVLLYHAAYKAFLQGHDSPFTRYAAHLDVGVPVFFLISGFLLYRPLVAARLRGEPMLDANAYGWRRILRIVPAYWVALVVAALAGASYWGYPAIFSLKGALAYFGFLQIYTSNTAAGGINVAWTLCVEVTFYAFLPLWAALLRRTSPRRGVRGELGALGALVVASTAWQAFALHHTDPNGFGLVAAPWIEPLPNFLDQFAVGMALAVVSVAWQTRALPRALRPIERLPGLGWLGAAVAFWVVSTRLGLDGSPADRLTPSSYLGRHELNTLIALCLLAPAVLGDQSRGFLRRVLALPQLAFLGTVSYGIYLYHVPLATRLAAWGLLPRDTVSLARWLALELAGTVALAWLSYRLVERPALRLKGRLGGRARTGAPAPRQASPVPLPAGAGASVD